MSSRQERQYKLRKSSWKVGRSQEGVMESTENNKRRQRSNMQEFPC